MKKPCLLLLMMVSVLVSCAGPQFFYDYDRQADFSDYQTYAYYPDMETGLSDLDAERVVAAIDSILSAKNIHKATDPDFKINFYASYYEKPSRSTIGLGIGGGGGGVGIGVSGGIPIGDPDLYLSLTIEFVEAPTNILFWQTVIESKMNRDMTPVEKIEYFQGLIAEALQDYPPEKEG